MTYTDEELEAIQHVVERVGANWDGTTTQTVEEKLRHALSQAGADIDQTDVKALAEAIESNHGTVDVSSVIGG